MDWGRTGAGFALACEPPDGAGARAASPGAGLGPDASLLGVTGVEAISCPLICDSGFFATRNCLGFSCAKETSMRMAKRPKSAMSGYFMGEGRGAGSCGESAVS